MVTKTDKGYRGLPMEGLIASWYAKTTAKDMARHHGTARELAELIPAGSRVLEIAPGPGYFAIELAQLGEYDITGLDISETFVEIARKNAEKAGVLVDFRLGNASDMPFEDESFDWIICQAAFKNFSQPVQAIAEMYRVLRPNGTALIIDLRREASPEDIERGVQEMNVGPVNRFIVRWTFNHMLLKRAYTGDEMKAFAAQTPFKTCRIENDWIGFRAWFHK